MTFGKDNIPFPFSFSLWQPSTCCTIIAIIIVQNAMTYGGLILLKLDICIQLFQEGEIGCPDFLLMTSCTTRVLFTGQNGKIFKYVFYCLFRLNIINNDLKNMFWYKFIQNVFFLLNILRTTLRFLRWYLVTK